MIDVSTTNSPFIPCTPTARVHDGVGDHAGRADGGQLDRAIPRCAATPAVVRRRYISRLPTAVTLPSLDQGGRCTSRPGRSKAACIDPQDRATRHHADDALLSHEASL
jgi:hypothetical protein